MRDTTHSSVEPRSMFSIWGPRVLAPIFLIACAIAVLSVVNANESEAPAGGERTQQAGNEGGGGGGGGGEQDGEEENAEEETYTVQSGDTLSGIAEETGVSVARIERANPDLDTTALSVGQVLNLR